MFGLPANDWRDLLLSVNVHRSQRRLSPTRVAELLDAALRQTDLEQLSKALNFSDKTTLERIRSLRSLPADLGILVDWGSRKGVLSMSTAAQLVRLKTPERVRAGFKAAVENDMTKEEARQVIQILERSGKPLPDCISTALATRPKIIRSELIIGSLVSDAAKKRVEELGEVNATRKLRMGLARNFPEIIAQSFRIANGRFSLLLSEEHGQKLRLAVAPASIEVMISGMAEALENT
jgi:hypothetical protein